MAKKKLVDQTLLEKLDKVIEDHINDLVEKKVKSELDKRAQNNKQSMKDFIKHEISEFSVEAENPYTDVFGNQCIISEMTKDHIMPQAEKGSNIKANIIWMCGVSNKSKGNKLEGTVNKLKFKVVEDKKTLTKNGKRAGQLAIKGKVVSINKENKRFEAFKKEAEE